MIKLIRIFLQVTLPSNLLTYKSQQVLRASSSLLAKKMYKVRYTAIFCSQFLKHSQQTFWKYLYLSGLKKYFAFFKKKNPLVFKSIFVYNSVFYMAIYTTYQVDSFGMSDIGLVRDHNEDVWAAYPDSGLFLLADGMGGHAAGEIAAQDSVQYFYELVKQWHPTKQTSPDEAVSFFRESFQKVNASIYQKGQTDHSLSGMGTTLCILYFLRMHAIIAHVGDSRIYRLRAGVLEQLTEDHSLVSELISIGAMKPDDAESFPYKHILTRAIGTHTSVEPTVNYLNLQLSDSFLLCSDGLTNYVTDSEIEMILKTEGSLQEHASALINLANEHGGGDNITVVLVQVNEDLSR